MRSTIATILIAAPLLAGCAALQEIAARNAAQAAVETCEAAESEAAARKIPVAEVWPVVAERMDLDAETVAAVEAEGCEALRQRVTDRIMKG